MKAADQLAFMHEPVPVSYDELIRLFPLRPITDSISHGNAVELAARLAGHPKLSKDQRDYLIVLSTIIGSYESQTSTESRSRTTPIDMLTHLMELHGMSASALGELLGSRELGSRILRGERELSKAHIRALANHFKVNPGLFL